MILNLGVIDLPYSEDKDSVSTAKVAKFLEANYGVMRAFYNLHKNDIAKSLEESVKGTIDNILSGSPINQDPFVEGTNEIEELFKFTYLELAEVEGLGIKGVPTLASIERRSLRFKSKKGKNRPSFIDTGLYEKSFKAWVEK